MAKSILIEGLPASGKTCSCRNLDPKTTFWINSDGKFDPWKGFSKQYNKANKNYFKCNNSEQILSILDTIDKQQKQIKTVVIDTINSVMVGMEMADKSNGFQKWSDIAQFGYDVVQAANNLRDDLIVILIGHTAISDEGFENLVVNGRKLEKIQLTAYMSLVLLARHEDDKYKLITRSADSSARVPFGYFDGIDEIENDITIALKELDWMEK